MKKWDELKQYLEEKIEQNPNDPAYKLVLAKMLRIQDRRKPVRSEDTPTFKQLCAERGVKYTTFAHRYYKLGWTLEEALTPGSTSANRHLPNSERFTYKGETEHLGYFAKKYNIVYSTLYSRVTQRGWSIEKAIEAPLKPTGRKRRS